MGCLSAQTSISQPQSSDLDKVRAGMKAAGFAPVRAASLTGTWEGYLKSYRQWLVRNFAVPMKAAIASEPWAEDAVAFVHQMIESRFSGNFLPDPVVQHAAAARKLIAKGADDPVVLWLAAEALAFEWKDPGEARRVGDLAREAFPGSRYSRALGTLLYVQKAAKNRAALEKDDEESYLKAVAYLADSLKEPATWEDADAPVFITMVYEWFSGGLCVKKKENFSPVFHPDRFPEWAKETLAGFWEVELGWEGRGGDWASEVSEEGWMAFGDHLTKANGHLSKAWKLEPRQPFAAGRMISLAMADHALETPRVWFDRAVASRIDYVPAWRALSLSMRPRWGGNIQSMKGLALATVECQRFDTQLPFHLLKELEFVLDEMRGTNKFHDLYSEPAVAAAMKLMCQNYLSRAKFPAERNLWSWWLATTGWESRDLASTAAVFASTSLGKIPPHIKNRLARKLADEFTLRGEAALYKAGKLELWERVEKAYLGYELDAAGRLLDTIPPDPASKPLLDRRRNTIEFEKKLESGQWVQLPSQDAFADWLLVVGDWRYENGSSVLATADGNRALMVHRTKIGGSFEARGTVSAKRSDKPFTAGFVIDYVAGASGTGIGKWVNAEFYSLNGGSSARINQNWFKTGIPLKRFTADFSAPVPWSIKVFQDRLTWSMNGNVLYSGELLKRDDNLSGFYNPQRNARFGFCSRVTPEENTLTFSPVEIRRLK